MIVRLSRSLPPHPPAVGARPPGHGGGTRAMHPRSARHGGPATRRPAAVRGPRRSAPTREGVVGRATRAGYDPRRTIPREGSDAMNARGLQRFGETHRWQNGGQPPRQHRFPDPRWAEEQQVVIRIAVPLSTLSPLQAGVDGCCDHKQDVTSRTGSSLQVHGIAGGRQST
jgi:hypothetical protein